MSNIFNPNPQEIKIEAAHVAAIKEDKRLTEMNKTMDDYAELAADGYRSNGEVIKYHKATA